MGMFVDAQEMHRKYPDTFDAPTKKELNELKPGDLVKVCYNDEERFWVIIKSIKGNKITGTVDNELLTSDLQYGDTIQFEKKNIYSIWGE